MIKRLICFAKWRLMRPNALQKWATFRHAVDAEHARQKLVRYAMERTAFYKKFYEDAGFKVEDIGTPGWFEKLPILTKAHLRAHFEEMTVQELKQFRKISTTGGSTGEPTKTGYDGRAVEEVYSWRLQESYGVHPWDDHAYVWRDTRHSFKARLINALLWWPTRHIKLDATFITPEAIEKFIKKFNRVKPKMLQGYVGALCQVAQYVVDHKLKVHAPKMVWSTSAPLAPVQRKLLVEAFGAPVCDQYGSCEIRWIAQEEPNKPGLRVNTEHVYLEYVDETNQPVPMGEYGTTLLTNLEDYVFPMIRYANGDRGRYIEEGRIDSVKGRVSESFVLPSGKTINGEYLTTIFDATPELVKGFRCVQHKDASITIEYIPRGSEEDILKVLNAFAKNLGGEVTIDFKKVDSIAHDRGKLRFVVREK